MREQFGLREFYGEPHSTDTHKESKKPSSESKEAETETPPETKPKDAMIKKELNLFEKVRGRAKEVAAVLALVTALSALGPTRAETGSWYGSKTKSRIETVQKEEEKEKVRVLEYCYAYDKKGRPPEWVNKKFFKGQEDDKEYVYSVGKARGVDLSLTRRVAEAGAKKEILKQLREKFIQEIKKELLKRGKSKEYVESEEFETGINYWLNEAFKKGIPFVGGIPDESCYRKIEVIEEDEPKILYEAHARFKMPEESFNFAYTQLKDNVNEAMKPKK